MATQTEILERQEAATESLEQLQAMLHRFIHGTAVQTINTESGVMPTLAGLIEEIRQRAGYRRHEVSYFVYDLLRYHNKAEPMFVSILTKPLWFNAQLAGSYFRLLAGPSGAAIVFELTIGDTTGLVTFASGATEGVVSGFPATFNIPAGTTVALTLRGESMLAKSFHMNLLGLTESP